MIVSLNSDRARNLSGLLFLCFHILFLACVYNIMCVTPLHHARSLSRVIAVSKLFYSIEKFHCKYVSLGHGVCFLCFSLHALIDFFPTLEEKKHTRQKHEMQTFCTAVRLRYRARFVTHCVAFVFLCLWLPAQTAVVQDLCLVEGNTKIEICRGK